MLRKMVILDFERQRVIFCELPEDQEPEELIEDRGLSTDNCHWMVTDKELMEVEW